MNYARLASSEAYRQCCGLAAGLQALDPNALQGQAERTAFWLNQYNALMVDAVIQLGVRTSVIAMPGLFWRAAYRIGGLRFSLNDIEHGILRANAGHPAIPGAHFAASDPRRGLCLPVIDPRIHFALNCASRSCPPIATVPGDRLSFELDQAAASFLESGGMQFNIDRRIVWLSQLFRWYAADFGGRFLAVGSRQPLLDFVARYQSAGPVREFLTTGQPRVRFLSYDWSLNR